MGDISSADAFLSALTINTVEFEVSGQTLLLQGFTKDIQQQARKNAKKKDEWDQWAFELEVFKHGVVEPKFTDAQLDQIRTTISVSDFDAIVNKIIELSEANREESAEAESTFLPKRKQRK